MQAPDSRVQSIEMYAVAGEYCHFIEECSNYPVKEVLEFLQKMLPFLYLKASILTMLTPEEDAINERYVSEEQYETLFLSLRQLFGDNDEFREYNEEGFTQWSLSEILSDIYQDMKDFCLLYSHPLSSAKQQASLNIKVQFAEHWGKKAIIALSHIHNIFQSGNQDDRNIYF